MKSPKKRIIIRGILNVSVMPLSELPLEGKKIETIWTILDEASFYKGFDPVSGQPIEVLLEDAKLMHGRNAFVEDKLHDWDIRGGDFHFYSRIAEAGEKLDLLVEYTDLP